MYRNSIKKIVVIGPESTGKTTLCTLLAEHFKTNWVPEYAREYLLTHGMAYTFEDLYTIATGQLEGEDELLKHANGLLFIDTDMQVIRVWSEFVFNQCDNRVLTHIANRSYDLYLLCHTDQPWVKDELREYPDLEQREKLFHYYKETLISQSIPWVEIKGSYNERFATALNAVQQLATS